MLSFTNPPVESIALSDNLNFVITELPSIPGTTPIIRIDIESPCGEFVLNKLPGKFDPLDIDLAGLGDS